MNPIIDKKLAFQSRPIGGDVGDPGSGGAGDFQFLIPGSRNPLTGQFKTSYRRDQAIFPIAQDRWCIGIIIAIAYVVIPLIANEYWLQAILIPFLVFSLAAIGLNLLTMNLPIYLPCSLGHC